VTSLDGVQAEVDRLEGDGFNVARLCVITQSRERIKISFGWRFLGLFGGGLKLTIDGNVGVLIEAGIRLHARFGLFVTFEDFEVVVEEAEMPFKACAGCVVFEGVGLALGFFDKFAIGYTGSRPRLGEMVGVELENIIIACITAYNDMFAVFATFFVVIHGTAEGSDTH